MSLDRSTIRAVIAVDFGTSRSGFAYSLVGQKEEPHCHFEWPSAPVPYEKTLTHLLYGPNGEVDSWGYPASLRFAEVQRDNRTQSYTLFKNFKMDLHEKRTQTWDNQPIIIERGQRYLRINNRLYPVGELVAAYLRKLKNYLLIKVQEGLSGHILPEEILWCLTIPAIWTDADKQLMREAAKIAGIISSSVNDEERLVLVLEPEAAAIRCIDKDTSIAASALRPDSVFMVVDVGGGTVDITVHKVALNKKTREFVLKELVAGSGGPYGSIYVDNSFLDHLERRFGDVAIKEFREKESLAYLNLMNDWEARKCRYDPDEASTMYIAMPSRLYKYIHKNRENLAATPRYAEALPEDNIAIDLKTVKEIFRPALDGIVDEMRKQFNSLQGKACDYIFLVGGFSSSPLLQERIKKEFGAKVKKIVIPPRPGSAILLGAVALGLNPGTIRSRRTRLTYGIETCDNFDNEIDPPEKKRILEDGEVRCDDRFSVFVTAGEGVSVDQAIKHTYYPLYSDQKHIAISIFATQEQEVRYIDEPGCEKNGEVTISRNDTSSGKDWPVEVAMFFGRTEIRVEAKDKHTGNVVKTNVHFSPEYFTSIKSGETRQNQEAIYEKY